MASQPRALSATSAQLTLTRRRATQLSQVTTCLYHKPRQSARLALTALVPQVRQPPVPQASTLLSAVTLRLRTSVHSLASLTTLVRAALQEISALKLLMTTLSSAIPVLLTQAPLERTRTIAQTAQQAPGATKHPLTRQVSAQMDHTVLLGPFSLTNMAVLLVRPPLEHPVQLMSPQAAQTAQLAPGAARVLLRQAFVALLTMSALKAQLNAHTVTQAPTLPILPLHPPIVLLVTLALQAASARALEARNNAVKATTLKLTQKTALLRRQENSLLQPTLQHRQTPVLASGLSSVISRKEIAQEAHTAQQP